ncbi:MAG: hypothetical protein K2X86_18705, partial [Cytophagaceae bacterium]|nr:hypothetical protein [Cytophagaceae bacterium]
NVCRFDSPSKALVHMVLGPPIERNTSLPTLLPNDVFVVDGFKVRVVSATGSNGTYSGAGVAYIPFLGINVRMHFNNIKINANSEVYEGKVIADKASLEQYRSRIPSPSLKNDICQEVTDNGSNDNPKVDGKGDGPKNTPEDSIKVIVINGDIKIKPGDTITVNGVQVIVTNDTKINPGDVIVVDGKTITVNSVDTKSIPNNPPASPEFTLKVKELLTKIRDQKYDSLMSVKDNFLADVRRIKSNSSITVPNFGSGTNIPLESETSSTRQFKPITGQTSTAVNPEKAAFMRKKQAVISLYASIAASNEIMKDENIDEFSAELLSEVEGKTDSSGMDLKSSDQGLQRVILQLLNRYIEENFNQ